MADISILHLSDIHFKKDLGGTYPPFPGKVNEWLIDRIKTHLEEIDENLDYVVVTGDITFSGKAVEFETAKNFFGSLKKVVPEKTELLIVPGNHDVDRNKVNSIFRLHKVVSSGESENFLKNEDNIRFFVNPKFELFYKFVNEIQPGLYGDCENYFWVKDNLEKNVSFLGLNSCWASEEKSENMKIALGLRQLNGAIAKSKTTNRIILMHHPLDNWFYMKDINECKKEILDNCKLILHGHNHQDAALVTVSPDHSLIQIGANASYTDGKNGFIGFQFIRISIADTFKLKVWPYYFRNQRNEFVPDTQRYRAQKNKEFFEICPFKASVVGTKKPVGTLIIPDSYREWMEDFHSTLPIKYLAKKDEAFTVPLPQVYIPIETTNPFYKEEMKRIQEEKERLRIFKGEDGGTDVLKPKESSVIDIEVLLGRQDTVLLRGEPGMGKTTLVRHLAYMIVNGWAKPGLQGYLPVLVFLKDLLPLFEKEIAAKKDEIKFELILDPYFDKIACPLNMGIVKDFLNKGRVIFLIDGLDEIPENLRDILVEYIALFRTRNKENKFLLTGRSHGINGIVMDRFGKFLKDIEALDQDKIKYFISNWYREICKPANWIENKNEGDLITDILTNKNIAAFIRNPLLLTAVCILYKDNEKLPEQRVALYDRIVEDLLHRRFSDPTDPKNIYRIEKFLMRLAFFMQEKNQRQIEPYEVIEILKQFYPKKENEEVSEEYNLYIEKLFDEIEPNCGLLSRQSDGDVNFFHRTFREFLAAKYMVVENVEYKSFLSFSSWYETILFYGGLISLRSSELGNLVSAYPAFFTWLQCFKRYYPK